MITNQSNLDLSRLDKVRYSGRKVIARCPACAERGDDRKGNHLCIFPAGGVACAAMPGDSEHNRRVFALAGIVGERERDPDSDRIWREQRATEQRRAKERQRLIAVIQAKREAIIARYPWEMADVGDGSPQWIDCDLVEFDPRHFLFSLFPQDAVVWTGEVYDSGTRHANHWRSVADWHNAPLSEIGPMTTPSIWKIGTTSRTAENVISHPYTVFDFDGFDGRKPETPAEIELHLRNSLSLVRWFRKGLGWELAAIVYTGSKSVHAWVHTPPAPVRASLKDAATALGMDAGLIGSPEHPCRLPGQAHEKTGVLSRVLWLQAP